MNAILKPSAPATIEFIDLKAQYRAIKPQIDEAIQRVVDSQHFILGPEVVALEKEVAAYSNTKHGVGMSSGTDALLAALSVLAALGQLCDLRSATGDHHIRPAG